MPYIVNLDELLADVEHAPAGIAKAIVGDLFSDCLNRLGPRLDDWQRFHLAHAIGCLNMNSGARYRESKAWLKAAMYDLDLTFTPEVERGRDRSTEGPLADASIDDFREALAGARIQR